jgi:hypothetical protein
MEKQCVVIWHNRWTGADEEEVRVRGRSRNSPLARLRAMIPRLVRTFSSHPEDEGSKAPHSGGNPVQRIFWKFKSADF